MSISRDNRFCSTLIGHTVTDMTATPLHTTPDAHTAAQLAEAVVADGFAAHRTALDAFLRVAAARAVAPTLVPVVADETAPRPVRERALGKVVMAFCRSLGRPGGDGPVVRAA